MQNVSKYDIKVDGVNPEAGFEEYLELELDNLMESAPSDACASTCVTQLKNGYTGVLNVVSSQGRFVAKAVGSDLKEIVSILKKQIYAQIGVWRGTRFNDENEIFGGKSLWKRALAALTPGRNRTQPA